MKQTKKYIMIGGMFAHISKPDCPEVLRALWHAAYPEVELCDIMSEQWKEMRGQGKDPSTDFRY